MFRAVRYYSTARMAAIPTKPLLAIVGATGTGKSDLAVEIARRFNGEIINGDAMQLYEGLPVITNKITSDEMQGIPHHLLGCIGLDAETWTVGKFVNKALGIIDEIRSRGKLPILVGGTHYYTQSLLFKDALSDEPQLQNEKNKQDGRFTILDEPTEVILAKLKEVDPIMADRWHFNDRRKIRRSLEIYLETGKSASETYEEQRLKRDDSEESPFGFRFPTLLFWVHASRDVLTPRLDNRIDKMMQKGLLAEVQTLSDFATSHYERTGTTIDLSRGIWVSIGYKEFAEYQAALSDPSVSETDLEKLKSVAIEKTQAATRQYAKRQIRWIRIKLLNAIIEFGQENNIFLQDGSNLGRWAEDVVEPSIHVTEQFLAGKPLPNPREVSEAAQEMLTPTRDYDMARRPDLWQKKVCETCGTVAVTENDWHLHIKSRAHRRAVATRKKEEHRQNSAPTRKKGMLEDTVDIFQSSQYALSDDITDLKTMNPNEEPSSK